MSSCSNLREFAFSAIFLVFLVIHLGIAEAFRLRPPPEAFRIRPLNASSGLPARDATEELAIASLVQTKFGDLKSDLLGPASVYSERIRPAGLNDYGRGSYRPSPAWQEWLRSGPGKLGAGAFGTVWDVNTKCRDNTGVAVKEFKNMYLEEIDWEVNLQRTMSRTNLVAQVYASDRSTGEMMVEKAHGSLWDLTAADRSWMGDDSVPLQKLVASCAFSLMTALDALHGLDGGRYVHRDLKGGNALVQVQEPGLLPSKQFYTTKELIQKCAQGLCRYLLNDFGGARRAGNGNFESVTPAYVPPDAWQWLARKDLPVFATDVKAFPFDRGYDMFAMGLILWELWGGKIWTDLIPQDQIENFLGRSLGHWIGWSRGWAPTVENSFLQRILNALLQATSAKRQAGWSRAWAAVREWLASVNVPQDSIIKPPEVAPCVVACMERNCKRTDHPKTECDMPKSGDRAGCRCPPDGPYGDRCRDTPPPGCSDDSLDDNAVQTGVWLERPDNSSWIGWLSGTVVKAVCPENMHQEVFEVKCTDKGWERPHPICTPYCNANWHEFEALIVTHEDGALVPNKEQLLPGRYDIQCPPDTIPAPRLPKSVECIQGSGGKRGRNRRSAHWEPHPRYQVSRDLRSPCYANPHLTVSYAEGIPLQASYVRIRVFRNGTSVGKFKLFHKPDPPRPRSKNVSSWRGALPFSFMKSSTPLEIPEHVLLVRDSIEVDLCSRKWGMSGLVPVKKCEPIATAGPFLMMELITQARMAPHREGSVEGQEVLAFNIHFDLLRALVQPHGADAPTDTAVTIYGVLDFTKPQ